MDTITVKENDVKRGISLKNNTFHFKTLIIPFILSSLIETK